MGDIVRLNNVTRIDIPADVILEAALKANLKSVVLVGYGEDGDIYAASSLADGADALWMIEILKLKLLNIATGGS